MSQGKNALSTSTLDQHMKDVAILGDIQQLIACPGSPRIHVGLDTRIGSQKLKHITYL
jgi:hypothetical protein